ncbi:MAG: sigma-70 family RNA polymerase sigma factor [Solirubrobacteraceae bacterium]|jgi:RNA polymerase sigma-70 factor (ECF subfamily)
MKQQSTQRRERFEALFERYQGNIAAYAMRRAPGGLVDDVVEDTFLVAWRSLDRLPEDPLPWLYGVARRVLANDRRAQRRRAALGERLSREPAPPAAPAAFDASVSEPLRSALLALSAREREALLLVAWEGLTPAQAAIAAGCADAAMRVRLHRARRALARALTPAADAAATDADQLEPARETP